MLNAHLFYAVWYMLIHRHIASCSREHDLLATERRYRKIPGGCRGIDRYARDVHFYRYYYLNDVFSMDASNGKELQKFKNRLQVNISYLIHDWHFKRYSMSNKIFWNVKLDLIRRKRGRFIALTFIRLITHEWVKEQNILSGQAVSSIFKNFSNRKAFHARFLMSLKWPTGCFYQMITIFLFAWNYWMSTIYEWLVK